ncbi:MAG TPA: right-handed parallel beta-helix repeat-containing protein [Chitinophagaceae bacterium]
MEISIFKDAPPKIFWSKRKGSANMTHIGMYFYITVIVFFVTNFHAVSQSKNVPPASSYIATEIQSVKGGLTYGLSIQQNTSEIYAAAETMRGGFFGAAHDPNNGTWKSDDMGKNWHRIGPGGGNVKVSQTDPNVIYSNDRYGIYKTIDGGKNWTTINDKMWAVGYKGLDVFAKDGNIVYAGGKDWLGISRDGGKTWTDNPLPKDTAGKPARIQVIQIHPTNPNIVYLAFYDGAKNGIWKTTDAGKTFTLLHASGSRAMSLSPSNPDVLYCGDAVTHDGGKTWLNFQSEGTGPWCILVHPTNPEVAYYSRPGAAVWRTKNGGKSFATILGVEHNLDGTEVEAMAIDIKHDRFWVGGDRIWKGEQASSGQMSLVRSDDGYHVISIADIISTPFSVWAPSDAQGTHFTTDGKTWTTNSMGMQAQEALHRIAPSPKNPKVIYAGHETRLYKSEDGGTTWFGILGSWFPYCRIDPNDDNIIYVSGNSGKGDMSRSINGGETFQQLGKGTFLALDGKNNAIYAETPDGFMVSHNHAETFTKVSDEKGLGDFFLTPANTKLMFSARALGGLYRSTDGGVTWNKLPVELKGPTRFAQSGDGAIWMSDLATGTARSFDNGNTWEKVWDGFGALASDPWNKNSLYMGTRGGIWWLHPKTVQRKETMNEFKAIDGSKKTIPFSDGIFANRSNAKYILTKDVVLKGKVHDLVMMPRGLKNVTFDGQGHNVTITGGNTFFGDDLENITIENFHFIHPATGDNSPVLYLGHGRNITIRNCTFDVTPDFVAGRTGVGTEIETRGLFTDNVIIENCTFKTPGRAPLIYGNGKHIIRNCTFDGNRQTNILLTEADGSVIEKNNNIGAATVHVSYLK